MNPSPERSRARDREAPRRHSEGPGKGAEFALTIPLHDDAPGERAAEARPSPAAERRRVLVVDDNGDAADALAALVGLFGHEVEIAYDGPSAIEKARRHRPDVVFCDIGLPGMTGYEVARRLRAEHDPALRLVAVSGYARAEDVDRAAEAGFDAHLAKPPDPERLASFLRSGDERGARRYLSR